MKNIILLVLLFAFSSTLNAGEQIYKTLDVSATVDIKIEDPNSRIEVIAWNKRKVKVSGKISDRAKGYTFEKHGNNVIFTVEYKGKEDWRDKLAGKDNSKLKFHVPAKARLQVSNVNGYIEVIGIEGGTSIESINGDIAAEKLKQRISLETINGSITTDNIHGKISIETINGSVKDNHSSGELSISSVQGDISSDSHYSNVEIEIVNGDLDLDMDEIDELSIDSVNGKIAASLHLNKKGEVSVSNVNGSINLAFNKDVSADFQIDAFVGGHIINKLTSDQAEKQKFGPGRSMHFSKDGGSARVSVNTVSGKVKISAK